VRVISSRKPRPCRRTVTAEVAYDSCRFFLPSALHVVRRPDVNFRRADRASSSHDGFNSSPTRNTNRCVLRPHRYRSRAADLRFACRAGSHPNIYYQEVTMVSSERSIGRDATRRRRGDYTCSMQCGEARFSRMMRVRSNAAGFGEYSDTSSR